MDITHHMSDPVNGIRLHYVKAGSGEPLVLLHGWPQSWYEWLHIIPAMAKKFTVIAPDLRGFGDSDKPSSGYDKRTVAQDIRELVLQLGFKNINLAGHDIGMMVAYEYASQYPAEVQKLSVLDAALPGLGLEALQDSSMFPHLWHFGFFRAPGIAETLIQGKERIFLSSFIRELSYNPYAVTNDEINEYSNRMSAPGALRSSFEHYRSFPIDAENNISNAKTKLPMPVLAIGGSHSMGLQVGKIMEPLANNVRSVSIDKCGHWVPEEQPEELIQLFSDFFDT